MTHDTQTPTHEPALPNRWYGVFPMARLGRRPAAIRRFGLPLVLYRRADGQAVAMLDRCPHRGAALSRGRVRGRAGRREAQAPAAEHDGAVGSEQAHVQDLEAQLTHRARAVGAVAGLVAGAGVGEAALDLAARGEHEVGAGIVAAQEALEIAAVPRVLLGLQDRDDGGPIARDVAARIGVSAGEAEDHDEDGAAHDRRGYPLEAHATQFMPWCAARHTQGTGCGGGPTLV